MTAAPPAAHERPAEGSSGTLFVCAGPIGNLEDLTARTLRILGEVQVVACEDTRRTRILLGHHHLHPRLLSYHEHNRREAIPRILASLHEGSDVALLTDAGTPGISDPGAELVAAAFDQGIRVVPLPGPSAVTTALSVAGFSASRFTFEGFLPRKSGERRRAIEHLRDDERTVVFFETPHRLASSLQDLAEVLGGERRVLVARELTKVYEETIQTTLSEAAAIFEARRPRGEFTLVIEGAARRKRTREARERYKDREGGE